MNNHTIINAIHANNNADLTSDVFVPFETDTTTGYIPAHLHTFFLDTGDFEFDGKTLRFTAGLENKSGAMDKVRDLMIKKGAIKRKPSHYADERLAVGNENRLTSPEFTVDRAYYFASGFQLDAVSVQMHGKINGEDKILLQRRGQGVIEPGTHDFAAGGAVKSPETNHLEAVANQISHEIGSPYANLSQHVKHVASVQLNRNIVLATPSNTDFIGREASRIPIYDITLPENTLLEMLDKNGEEVDGFILATPDEIIQYCLNGEIAPVMVQSFMSALIATNLIPENSFSNEVQHVLTEKGGCVFKIGASQHNPSKKPSLL